MSPDTNCSSTATIETLSLGCSSTISRIMFGSPNCCKVREMETTLSFIFIPSCGNSSLEKGIESKIRARNGLADSGTARVQLSPVWKKGVQAEPRERFHPLVPSYAS